MPNSFWIQLVIIIIVTVLFMISAYTGLDKGIKILSNTNMIMAAALFLCILILGPTLYILNPFIESVGAYIQQLPFESLRIAPNDPEEQQWVMDWTVFFWAWWISWSPFIGIFIARVSKGRTIREFVWTVLTIPSIICFFMVCRIWDVWYYGTK